MKRGPLGIKSVLNGNHPGTVSSERLKTVWIRHIMPTCVYAHTRHMKHPHPHPRAQKDLEKEWLDGGETSWRLWLCCGSCPPKVASIPLATRKNSSHHLEYLKLWYCHTSSLIILWMRPCQTTFKISVFKWILLTYPLIEVHCDLVCQQTHGGV